MCNLHECMASKLYQFILCSEWYGSNSGAEGNKRRFSRGEAMGLLRVGKVPMYGQGVEVSIGAFVLVCVEGKCVGDGANGGSRKWAVAEMGGRGNGRLGNGRGSCSSKGKYM